MAIVEPIGPFDPEEALRDDPHGWRRSWITDGFVVFRGLYTEERTRRHREAVAAARAAVPHGLDNHGLGDRIGQLHQRDPSLMDLANEPRVLEFLRWAFGMEPVLFGSLNFDRGSQQDLHIDALFFCTEPIYAMAGLWVALEDVHPDAGPLFYVRGSHRWPFLRGDDVLDTNPAFRQRCESYRAGKGSAEERAAFIPEMGVEWTRQTHAIAAREGIEKVPVTVQRGDALIWHALLGHGGLPRKDPSRSRHSVVYHYVGAEATLHTFEDFFLCSREEVRTRAGVQSPRAVWKGLQYNKYDYFVSYDGGRELIHKL